MGARSLKDSMALGLFNEKRPQKIIHVDMDCFFAAVEELDNPDLKGKPIAVGGSPTGRGVLCTANYEAREYGVRSAMSSAEAIRKCPQLIFIRPRSRRYSEIASKIREVFKEVTPLIEPLSLDEAYLDVTDSSLFQGSATLMAKYIKDRIKEETGLTASAGVAPNKFLAKIASDWKKPNGLFVINPDSAKDFARNLRLDKVPGVGQVTFSKCQHLGLETLGDLQHYPLTWLESHFGKQAHSLYLKSFGIDNRKVEVRCDRKSIGHEETYNQDLLSFSEIEERIHFLWEELEERYTRHCEKRPNKTAVKIFVKVKTDQFKGHTLERMLRFLDLSIENPDQLKKHRSFLLDTTKDMFDELYQRIDRRPLRLLGLGFRLASSPQDELERLGQMRLL